jgi:murein L,D-transpeptidase YcbB/YkuD
MKSSYVVVRMRQSILIHLLGLALLALGMLINPGTATPQAWAAGDCAERYWEQIVRLSWKNWPSSNANSGPSAIDLQTSGGSLDNQGLSPASSASLPTSPWEAVIREALVQELLSDADRELMLEAYQQKAWEPVFITPGFQLSADGGKLLHRLGELESDALDAKPYQLEALQEALSQLSKVRQGPDQGVKASLRDVLQRLQAAAVNPEQFPLRQQLDWAKLLQTSLSSAEPDVRRPAAAVQSALEKWRTQLLTQAGRVDVRMTANLIRFAHDMHQFQRDKMLAALAGNTSLDDLRRSLEPSSTRYEILRQAYLTYRNLARKNTQKTISTGGSVRPGTQGALVRALQDRLQEEGFYHGDLRGHYDAATIEAVKHFQMQHLQDPDGVLGAKTVVWLNVPYEKKAGMIAQSLEALRKSETRQYDRFVRINIPQFILEYFRDGRLQTTHRVIVGKASGKKIKMQGRMIGENQTPTLVSKINQVIFNPRWYVTDRISLELDVEASRDPSYWDRLGYVRMASTYPWGTPRLYQRPGPYNPLGRVKFEFPNAYAVFLHDTPKKQLFQRARRDFSHGCMRLEGAVEFARTLLKDDQNPAADKTERYLADNQQKYIELQQALPIFIEYSMATSDASGRIIFCGDLYGWFEKLG